MTLSSVSATAKLLAEGGTVPFISRYRKEQTGSLDEVQITTIRDRMLQLAELDTRRSAILKSLDERSLLTPGLKSKIEAALTLGTLEDLFAPFRPKRQTRATKAIERAAGKPKRRSRRRSRQVHRRRKGSPHRRRRARRRARHHRRTRGRRCHAARTC